MYVQTTAFGRMGMAMITLTTNTTNSRVGLCDTCGLCAQRRDILPTAGDERAQVEARGRGGVTSVLRGVEMYGINGLEAQAEKALVPFGISARHPPLFPEDLAEVIWPRGRV